MLAIVMRKLNAVLYGRVIWFIYIPYKTAFIQGTQTQVAIGLRHYWHRFC